MPNDSRAAFLSSLVGGKKAANALHPTAMAKDMLPACTPTIEGKIGQNYLNKTKPKRKKAQSSRAFKSFRSPRL
ncbi:50S ribosomal protein L30 [Frankliniella fusca]|uniref:50S ribosomal protein L30 n=1 Tax=Frankliniella fusca TaxID=407009 RepID=A0AAE1HEB3_9NEOP|nr:50S ribosomal protein L30 [Frankliniella fusca]